MRTASLHRADKKERNDGKNSLELKSLGISMF